MLVLTRRCNESIMINDDIEISILGISKGQIKIGFEAPKKMKIHRKEIYNKIQQEKANGQL